MKRRFAFVSLVAVAAIAAGTSPAQASAGFGSLPLALSAVAALEQGRCATATMPAYGAAIEASVAASPIAASKASAILGGQVSALEAMRLQQAALAPVKLATASLPGTGMVPRSGGECAMFIVPRDDFTSFKPGRGATALGADDFLASKRLAVKRTSFDAQWNRVRRDSVGTRTVAGLAGTAPGEALLTSVNSWANASIRYVEDRELYGKADYWAGAKATLRRRAGDCEDIALAKLALLAALGVPREAMYLTIARDLARNADHALLVVKLDGKHWLLDNATDRLLDASESYDYRPILSYSADRKWLHGY